MGKRGLVHISPVAPVPDDGSMIDPATGRFTAYWEGEVPATESAPATFPLLEEIEVVGAEEAIAWGRERSDVVLIRLGHSEETYFSAGNEHRVWESGLLPVWPPDGPPQGGWWQPRAYDEDL